MLGIPAVATMTRTSGHARNPVRSGAPGGGRRRDRIRRGPAPFLCGVQMIFAAAKYISLGRILNSAYHRLRHETGPDFAGHIMILFKEIPHIFFQLAKTDRGPT